MLNQKPVKNIQDLKQILDTLPAGSSVSITYQSQGKNLAIEGVVKEK